MPGLQDLCEKYFGCRDLYDVLKIPKAANEKQVRKAYHRLSLLVHPDRVEESKKVEATEKFKVLGQVHSILSNKERKAVYDETGEYDEDNDTIERDWSEYWRLLFKKITVEDINNYEKSYKGSEEELEDLKRAYLDGKGDMDFILEAVPFTNTEEESRLRELLQKLIDDSIVPEYSAFVNETPRKRERRKRKWQKEAEETSRMQIDTEDKGSDLSGLIQRKQEGRMKEMDTFLDALANKYAPKKKATGKSTGMQKKVNDKKQMAKK